MDVTILYGVKARKSTVTTNAHNAEKTELQEVKQRRCTKTLVRLKGNNLLINVWYNAFEVIMMDKELLLGVYTEDGNNVICEMPDSKVMQIGTIVAAIIEVAKRTATTPNSKFSINIDIDSICEIAKQVVNDDTTLKD